jgi:HEPN domain-containing protein
MPDPEKIAIVVSEWVAKAENDLTNAAHTLKLGKACPTDTVCFHAQQVVEKYLKALL